MSGEAPKRNSKPTALPFIVIALVTCVASYPVLVAIQLLTFEGGTRWQDVLFRTAIVLACCWALFSVALLIATSWLRRRQAR